jgi:hypothetical protein
MTRTELKLSCHSALLFNVIAYVKFIFINIEKDILVMFVYVDRELTSEERDVYYSLGGEICGDFPELSVSDVSFIVMDEPYENVEKLDLLIYARYEYLKNEDE